MRFRSLLAVSAFAFVAWHGSPSVGQTREPRLESNYTLDNSDWWSLLRLEGSAEPENERTRVRVTRPAEANFAILGVNLWYFDVIDQAKNLVSKGPTIERGDAASSRKQLCFQSIDGRYKLIFEEGEVDHTIYLIEYGSSWNGRDVCVVSPRVSQKLATESGLQLGMSVDRVRELLGTPSTETDQKLSYWSEWKHRIETDERQRFKAGHIPEDVRFLDRDSYIEIRFSADRATYIAISATETY